MKQELLWKPSSEFIENSNLKDFEDWLGRNKNLYFDSYSSLWEWSCHHLEDFWAALWEYFDIISHSPYNRVVSKDPMPKVKWFEGASLNYAEHIFRQKSEHRDALVFIHESGKITRISWNELESKVLAVQQFLMDSGIRKGDCVSAFLPNIPEAIILFLACNSLGIIWSCCSPDFGSSTVIERFSQIKPRILFATDGYTYNGKTYDKLEVIMEINRSIPSIEKTVIIPYMDRGRDSGELWNTIINAEIKRELKFVPVDFSHPIWVLYSSGTTGKPKAITHSHGGVLLEHLKYMAFHNDVHPGENFFWFTTTGWMMWNFLQASMLMGATPVLYDGSPAKPDMNILWKWTEELPIHHFGTSAPYLIACMKQELKINQSFSLEHLRSIGSTGAPLPPEAFKWIYENISKKVWLCSMSGGTDVCTAFVGGCPYENVYAGLIQCRALGCSMKALNEKGEEILNQLGEMVIDQPMPSMPIYFWGDINHQRYLNSYFDTFEGKWRHGDWIHLYENGALSIHGRSDATLNRKGIRIGTAEIYTVLNGIDEIKDGLIVNLEKEDGDDFMPLYVVLKEGIDLNERLIHKIKAELKTHCSPRHLPDEIIKVPDVPYTLSGKKMEVPVKKILMKLPGADSINKDAIRNPEAIDHFIELAKTLE